MLLNTASKVFVGDQPASAVYLGTTKVWPKDALPPPTGPVPTALLTWQADPDRPSGQKVAVASSKNVWGQYFGYDQTIGDYEEFTVLAGQFIHVRGWIAYRAAGDYSGTDWVLVNASNVPNPKSAPGITFYDPADHTKKDARALEKGVYFWNQSVEPWPEPQTWDVTAMRDNANVTYACIHVTKDRTVRVGPQVPEDSNTRIPTPGSTADTAATHLVRVGHVEVFVRNESHPADLPPVDTDTSAGTWEW